MSKITEFIKTHIKLSLGVGAVLIALIIVLILSVAAGDSTPWSEGIASDIPEFEGEITEYREGEDFIAAYYESASSESIGEYISRLESELGVKFSGEAFPKTAVSDDKIIVIHYSATEQKLSVTVTIKE